MAIFALAWAMLAASDVHAQPSSGYDLSWYTVDGGGVIADSVPGSPYALSGTAGQPDAGKFNTDPYTLFSGFWSEALTAECVIAGPDSACEQAQDVLYQGPGACEPGYAWWVVSGDCVIDGPDDQQTVRVDFGETDCTLGLDFVDIDTCAGYCEKVIAVHPLPLCQIFAPDGACTEKVIEACGPAGMQKWTWSVTDGDCVIMNSPPPVECASVRLGTEDCGLHLDIVDANGCASDCDKTVTVFPSPLCEITGEEEDDSVCEWAENVLYEGPNGMDHYAWSVGAGDCVIDGPDDQQTVRVDFGETECRLHLDIRDANDCPSDCDKTVTVFPSPPCWIAGLDPVCPWAQNVRYNGPNGMARYAWSVGAGDDCEIVGPANQQTVRVDFGVTECTLYLDIQDANGCDGVCEKVVAVSAPTCTIDTPTMPGRLTGSVTGGTAPYICAATTDQAGWIVDDCAVLGQNFLVTYHVEQPADESAGFTVTTSDSLGCPGECWREVNQRTKCGDGVLQGRETCDPGYPYGMPPIQAVDDACPGFCQEDCTCLPGRIPAVSEWGIACMALLLLGGAKIAFHGRRRLARRCC